MLRQKLNYLIIITSQHQNRPCTYSVGLSCSLLRWFFADMSPAGQRVSFWQPEDKPLSAAHTVWAASPPRCQSRQWHSLTVRRLSLPLFPLFGAAASLSAISCHPLGEDLTPWHHGFFFGPTLWQISLPSHLMPLLNLHMMSDIVGAHGWCFCPWPCPCTFF